MVHIIYPLKIGVLLGLLNLMISENFYRKEYSPQKISFPLCYRICFQEYPPHSCVLFQPFMLYRGNILNKQ